MTTIIHLSNVWDSVLRQSVCALFLLCCASIPGIAQQGRWVKIDSSYGTKFASITCLDDKHCIVCGDSAISGYSFVRQTSDGGKTWKTLLEDSISLIPTPQGDYLLRFYQAAYPSRSTIIAIADSGIVFRSNNAGITWDTLRLPVDNSPARNGKVFMLDTLHGYILSGRKVFQTFDGSNSWQQMILPDTVKKFSIAAIIPITKDTILLSAYIGLPAVTAMMLRSYDAGKTWDYNYAPSILQAGIMHFPDAQFGFAVGYQRTGEGDRALDLHTNTTDGGRTWTPIQKYWRDPALGLSQVKFRDRLNGIVAGGQGKVLRTTDGGITWNQQPTPLDTHSIVNIGSLEFPSLNTAYVGGWQFLLRWFPEPSDVSTGNSSAPHSPEPVSVIYSNNLPIIITNMKKAGDVRLEVVNIMGQTVMEDRIGMTDVGVLQRPLSTALSSGKYFVQVFVDNVLLGSTEYSVAR